MNTIQEIQLLKCHGSGNDFILIDEINGIVIAEDHKSKISQQLCDRHLCLGADGVLYLGNSTTADCAMRMFNPDGSEAMMCGNGLRCVARYYYENHYLANNYVPCREGNKISIETTKTILHCQPDGNEQGVIFYQTQIGPVSMDPKTLPTSQNQPIKNQIIKQLDNSLGWYGISITNPHLVAVTKPGKKYHLQSIGETANDSKYFPEGINCSLITKEGKNTIFVQTWERGAGLTNACGTAMAASCFIAAKIGLVEANSKVTIRNPGGKVYGQAPYTEGQMVLLSGNATFVYTTQCTYDITSGEIKGEIGGYNLLMQHN